jgi:phosphotransferase system HPr (HPr) family protein
MQTPPATRVLVIRNRQGMHARPAEMFVRLSSSFDAKIEIVKEDRRVSANSIIDLLTLGATQGTQLTLEAEGPDAEKAVEALADLVENVFPQEDEQQDSQGED